MQEYIDRAVGELQAKTLKQIQVETAFTWAGRACAAALLLLPDDAREYAHEAVEHAALSGRPEVLDQVNAALASHGVTV